MTQEKRILSISNELERNRLVHLGGVKLSFYFLDHFISPKPFFFLISLLTCHIFNIQHHFNVKNCLISNKFEILKSL
jgi:hypothetical protein